VPPFLPWILRKNTMGIRKPMPVLVVAPRIVITSAIVGTEIAMTHDRNRRIKVHRKFCLFENL